MKWYRMAADQGDPIGQNNIGLMYADGQGVEKDDKAALYWLTVSLIGGHETSRAFIEASSKVAEYTKEFLDSAGDHIDGFHWGSPLSEVYVIPKCR